MTLRELLEKYIGTPVVISDGAEDSFQVLHAINLTPPHGIADEDLERDVNVVRPSDDPECDQRLVWFVDSQQNEPDYILSNVPKLRKAGRPKERTGDYERITLEIKRPLLEKLDADRGDKSRREYIEELVQRS